MFQNRYFNKKGITVIEILIGVAIIGFILTSLLSLVIFSLEASISIKQTEQANNIAQGTMEQARNFRDNVDWNNGLGAVSAGALYHFEKSGDAPIKWALVPGERIFNGFTEKIVFDDVQRDGAHNIIESGGVIDFNTKKVTATVSWQKKNTFRQVELTTYLTNWQQ